ERSIPKKSGPRITRPPYVGGTPRLVVPLRGREQQRLADRGAALAGAVAADQLLRAHTQHPADALDEGSCLDEVEPLADEGGDDHALARRQVRPHRLEMVDELGQQLADEAFPAGQHQLVRSERGCVFVVWIAARSLASGAGDGEVRFPRGHLAKGRLEELAQTLFHVSSLSG